MVKPGTVVLLDVTGPPEIDVLVLVEPARATDPIDKETWYRYDAHLYSRSGAPMRRGADERSAGERAIDGLVQIIELGERTNSDATQILVDVVVPRREVVAR